MKSTKRPRFDSPVQGQVIDLLLDLAQCRLVSTSCNQLTALGVQLTGAAA